jgi:N-acyl-D-amino-acid deacylase
MIRRLTLASLLFCLCSVPGCARQQASGPTPPDPLAARPEAGDASPLDPVVAAVTCDLIIRNGRIIDGTGNPWFYGDVAVRDGRIIAVGDVGDLTPAHVIDASGRAVSPGFIDVHTHADADLHKLPLAENFVRDGVTTIVTGNCGYGVRDVAGYFNRLKQHGVALNVATLYGHNTILRHVKGDKAGALTAEQMQQAREMVRQAMRDGAVGLSTGLIYTPGAWSTTEEIVELMSVASEFGGIYATHMRSESTGIMNAIDEALTIGRLADCRVQISHFKLPRDVAARVGSDATIRRVLAARAAGQEVWVDQYPYTASQTTINTLLPDWVLQDGADEAKRKLQDPELLQKVLEDMKKSHEINRKRKDMSYAVISSSRAFPKLTGRNVKEVAQILKLREQSGGEEIELLAENPPRLPEVTMEDQYRAVIEIYLRGGASCVFHTMDENEVETIMASPLIAIASDSGVREFGVAQPHPRGYGTNARVLGKYVRERGIITLEDAVRKMTSLPALAFRFNDRGLLREGYLADIVIFDPETVIDRATFEKPHAYAEGFTHVFVNGQLVMENGRMTGTLPGQPVLGPGYGK